MYSVTFRDGLGRKGVKLKEARGAVRQIYLELLLREPDYPGAQGYVDCLVEGWCDVDFIRTELLKSDEYRQVQERLVVKRMEQAEQMIGGSSGFALPADVAGVPLSYIIGGAALFFLLKR